MDRAGPGGKPRTVQLTRPFSVFFTLCRAGTTAGIDVLAPSNRRRNRPGKTKGGAMAKSAVLRRAQS